MQLTIERIGAGSETLLEAFLEHELQHVLETTDGNHVLVSVYHRAGQGWNVRARVQNDFFKFDKVYGQLNDNLEPWHPDTVLAEIKRAYWSWEDAADKQVKARRHAEFMSRAESLGYPVATPAA